MTKKSLVLLTMLAVLTGCGHKDPKIYTQDGAVADGDILVESGGADPRHLMPPLVDETGGGDIDNLVFEGLARMDENFNPVPCLAEKWTISKNGKVITYYLRKGVHFQDGVEFNADDVLFTYKVYSDPTVNTPAGAMYQDIKSVEIMDLYTVRVTYKKPFAPALSQTFDNILPKHLLEGKDINKSDFDRHPVGTGPYKFVEWKTAQQVVLEANPNYWGGPPHIKRFVMRIIPDQSTEFLELLNGGIDAMGAWLHGGMRAEQFVKETDNPKFKDYYNSYKTDSLGFSYVGWNPKNPLFKDKKVRQALTMAIDRQTIIQNVSYGQGVVCDSPFPLHSWANDPKDKPWPFDPDKSRQYLKEAGWKMGTDGLLHKTIAGKDTPFKFTLITIQGAVSAERVATIMQQQMKQLGIEVDLQVYEWTTFLSQYLDPRKFDAYLGAWAITPDPDCYQLFHSSQRGEHQYNFVDYDNKQMDRLLMEGRQTLDTAKRQKIYWKIQSILHEDQPYTFLVVPNHLAAIHKRFKGYGPSQLVDPSLLTVNKWYVPLTQQKYSIRP